MNRAMYLILAFCFLISQKSSAAQYQLSILAIFRDEAPYLKEWIEFHRIVGVEHFYLINHLSVDHFQEVLQPYIDAGIVDLDHCSQDYGQWEWNDLQRKLYREKMEEIKYQTYWTAILDIDEFLFPVEKDNLIDFLKDYNRYAGVMANWQMYGTSHIEKLAEGDLQIEKLTWKAKKSYEFNHCFKSIVKLPYVLIQAQNSAHYCHYLPGYFAVTENYQVIKTKPYSQTEKVSINKIRINHYWTRDIDYLYNKKIPSYLKRRDESMVQWALDREANTNDVEDTTIWRFLPALKERMAIKE